MRIRPVEKMSVDPRIWRKVWQLTSPSNRKILKLRLLIFNCGEPGKQLMQLVRVYTRSRKYCAIAIDACEPLLYRVQASKAVMYVRACALGEMDLDWM
jgi:hypothetical protein